MAKSIHENVLNITIKKMQIKTTMIYHHTPVRITFIKKKKDKCLEYFPGGLVAKTPIPNAGTRGSISGQVNRSHMHQLRVCMLR